MIESVPKDVMSQLAAGFSTGLETMTDKELRAEIGMLRTQKEWLVKGLWDIATDKTGNYQSVTDTAMCTLGALSINAPRQRS